VAKIFDLHSFRKSTKKQASSKRAPNSDPVDEKQVLPIDMATRGSWPGPTSRVSLNAGAGLLVAIGILCGLYLSGNDKKKPDAQLPSQPAAQVSAAARPPAKPSPIVPIERARAESSIAPSPAPQAVVNLPAMPALRYPPMRYEATHKKAFGGCTGQLELTSTRLRFSCPNQSDLNFPVDAIAKAHKDGIVLKSGEKYHFILANYTKEQVEGIFLSWLNRVQQAPQTSRGASF
jgi:hypothetical protein